MKARNIVDRNRKRLEPPTIQKSKLCYSTAEAGEAISKSQTWMRTTRMLDAKRIEQGLPPVGPTWRVDQTGNVLYLADDLQSWLLRTTVEHGRSRFRGHAAEEVES
jgi:hypothetical protein